MLFDILFKRYYRQLCLYAAHYLKGDIAASEDIVQDCFVKLWQQEAKRDITDKRAFLYSTVPTASRNDEYRPFRLGRDHQ